ncbi:hypothetical protein [Cellulomonas composti]|uniref:RAMA domain-containing protein n=1 Tax=Cellulomonas composti TaxID=266130 RepID=A0A511JBA5_9CELL|nr:hypothetical protein [Cellulomonas composti]GEL95265.1 hypothetical protein CCO02nite_19230 [Cellulomonas composti]
MPIFELDDGRPRLVQPMQPLPGSFRADCGALLTHHLAAIAGEPLFAVRPRVSAPDHADLPELLALDATGRAVVVEVVQVLDDEAVVSALRHAGAAARMTATDLARAYHADPARFPVDFAAFREQVAFGAQTSRREGVRLVVLCSEVAPEAGDTLGYLRGPGRHVDVLQLGVVRGVDERRMLEVSPLARHEVTRRPVEPTALRLVRSSEASFATAMAYEGERRRPPVPGSALTQPAPPPHALPPASAFPSAHAPTRAQPTVPPTPAPPTVPPAPTVQAPATQVPATQIPATQSPATQPPAAHAPAVPAASSANLGMVPPAPTSPPPTNPYPASPYPTNPYPTNPHPTGQQPTNQPSTAPTAPPTARPAGPVSVPPEAALAAAERASTTAPTPVVDPGPALDEVPAQRDPGLPHPALATLAHQRRVLTTLVWFRERRGQRVIATLRHDGLVELADGRVFTDPGHAAAAAVDAPHEIDGWRTWRIGDGGPTLAEAARYAPS